VAQAVKDGYDGIIMDFIGYRNYHSCHCELCRAGLADFRAAHPGMPEAESAKLYFGDRLVALYDTLFIEIKARYPELLVTNHIHPVYLPDLFYAHRISTDYCGITVSWFFQPHWPREKVAEYIRRVVDGPYVHAGAQGMPLVGFYTDWPDPRDRKDRDRLAMDFELLEQAGAQHLLFCELGHILRDPAAFEVVKGYLAGK
jgi:hypothetical protein